VNIFIIPSWYPIESNPIAGIFFKEQAEYLAELYPDYNIGVSLWGQSDENLEIRLKDASNVLKKIVYYFSQRKFKKKVNKNLYEYYTPALIWTDKIFKGNLSGLVNANLDSLNKFSKSFGQVNVIHAHVSYPAGYIAMILSKKLNIPYVITEHMGPFPFPSFISKDGSISDKISRPLKNAERIIAVSPALAKRISSFNLPLPHYIPNVVNDDFFKEWSSSSVSPFVFFTLATLSPEKGITDLLSAIASLVEKQKKVLFRIGGGGEWLSYYSNLSKEMKIDNYIQWLGVLNREQAREEYQNCNAFVLPSHHETFGVVYAEAIACGKPIIATRCGGPECIVNESNGLLVNVSAPHDLSDKMLYMINNYSNYNSSVIRKGFEDNFSKKAVITQIVNIYKEILSK
jgi:glycosyltransferase involved in cell wall biosynthesis